ncbi:unnamed protein product [Effrenium voratum]|uniref:CBM20 domain-containing protein n=1 Tax=Effrenium voratum TaxID=2562239 RepID=A0AA36JHM6_9DINO|nr:unnamed protein product [Effrenium voratum]
MNFSVSISDWEEGQRIFMVGDPEELGSWVIEKGLPLRSFDRGQTFTATLPLDFLNKGSFAYKYVRADAIPEWERGANREWRKPERPLRCGYPSLTMNDGSFRSGQPMGDENANKIGYFASNAAAKDWTQSHLASIRADLHESETRVQRMIKMESERLQQLFNRAQHEISDLAVKVKGRPQRTPEVTQQGISYANIQHMIKTEASKACEQILQSKLGAWEEHFRRLIDDSNAQISEVIDELDEKVGMIKIETDETCAQCQADLGVQCDRLQCKIDAVSAMVPSLEKVVEECGPVTQETIGDLDKKIQTMKGELDVRCARLQHKIDAVSTSVPSPEKVAEVMEKTIGDVYKKIARLEREISDVAARMPRSTKVPEAEARLERSERRMAGKTLEERAVEVELRPPGVGQPKVDLLEVPGSSSGADPGPDPAPVGLPPPLASSFTREEPFAGDVLQAARIPSATPPLAPASRRLWEGPAAPEFEGHRRPPRPEDPELRRLTLQVEQDLWAARNTNLPVQDRKKLLQKVFLKIHPDKNKDLDTHECMTWFEQWKQKHLEWYFDPHDVPDRRLS